MRIRSSGLHDPPRRSPLPAVTMFVPRATRQCQRSERSLKSPLRNTGLPRLRILFASLISRVVALVRHLAFPVCFLLVEGLWKEVKTIFCPVERSRNVTTGICLILPLKYGIPTVLPLTKANFLVRQATAFAMSFLSAQTRYLPLVSFPKARHCSASNSCKATTSTPRWRKAWTVRRIRSAPEPKPRFFPRRVWSLPSTLNVARSNSPLTLTRAAPRCAFAGDSAAEAEESESAVDALAGPTLTPTVRTEARRRWR